MKFEENKQLASLTTFNCGGSAEYFLSVESEEDLLCSVRKAKQSGFLVTIISGGSNVLIDDNGLKGLVLHVNIKGISWHKVARGVFLCNVSSGENWDELVKTTVSNGLWGLENLSGIPGSVGASPIQNIGAYGSELKDVFVELKAVNFKTGEIRIFSKEECVFGYRSSYFKSKDGKDWIVISVTLKLFSDSGPNLKYNGLADYFSGQKKPPSLPEIRRAVLDIRGAKFPDLAKLGTAGSFFKNPFISKEKLDELTEKFPDIPSFYLNKEDGFKVPAAWILDKVCDLKGYFEGRVGLFERQPLVLVAEKEATSFEINNFAKKIQRKFFKETGVELEREVRYLPEDLED